MEAGRGGARREVAVVLARGRGPEEHGEGEDELHGGTAGDRVRQTSRAARERPFGMRLGAAVARGGGEARGGARGLRRVGKAARAHVWW